MKWFMIFLLCIVFTIPAYAEVVTIEKAKDNLRQAMLTVIPYADTPIKVTLGNGATSTVIKTPWIPQVTSDRLCVVVVTESRSIFHIITHCGHFTIDEKL
jgi:hypothetical protein